MSDAATTTKLRPLFLITPGTMSRKDIRRAEQQCGICIAECKAPEQARFLEPPSLVDADAQARAALQLFRYIVQQTQGTTTTFYGVNLVRQFVDTLLSAPRPANVPRVEVAKR